MWCPPYWVFEVFVLTARSLRSLTGLRLTSTCVEFMFGHVMSASLLRSFTSVPLVFCNISPSSATSSTIGADVGDVVGALVGALVGLSVSPSFEGGSVGELEGRADGPEDGEEEGTDVSKTNARC